MNEFLGQFLLESRELVEQATRELLALEQAPEEKDRLDAAFRAFHTLKGGAAIVDFVAMARALHVAEEALAVGRRGDNSMKLKTSRRLPEHGRPGWPVAGRNSSHRRAAKFVGRRGKRRDRPVRAA